MLWLFQMLWHCDQYRLLWPVRKLCPVEMSSPVQTCGQYRPVASTNAVTSTDRCDSTDTLTSSDIVKLWPVQTCDQYRQQRLCPVQTCVQYKCCDQYRCCDLYRPVTSTDLLPVQTLWHCDQYRPVTSTDVVTSTDIVSSSCHICWWKLIRDCVSLCSYQTSRWPVWFGFITPGRKVAVKQVWWTDRHENTREIEMTGELQPTQVTPQTGNTTGVNPSKSCDVIVGF